MKRIIPFIILLCCCTVYPETTDVYILLGQSNANYVLGNYLYGWIKQNNADAILIQNNHPGNGSWEWYDNGIQQNLIDDITYIDSELSRLHGYEVKGIFWFQGETDATTAGYVPYYSDRFMGIYNTLTGQYKCEWYTFVIGCNTTDQDLIERVQAIARRQCYELPNDYALITGSYERVDTYHLSNKGYHDIARDMVNKIF